MILTHDLGLLVIRRDASLDFLKQIDGVHFGPAGFGILQMRIL
jgi:hypothetical protein